MQTSNVKNFIKIKVCKPTKQIIINKPKQKLKISHVQKLQKKIAYPNLCLIVGKIQIEH